VDVGDDDSFALGASRSQHPAPRIDDHRMTKGLASVLVTPALSSGNHKNAVLDRARPQEDFPMGFASLLRKGGGHRHHLGAGDSLSAEKRREADVIANCKAHFGKRKRQHARLRSGTISSALAPAFTVVEIDIE